MLNSKIRVYLTKESIGWIIGKKGWRIKKISKDTNCFIKYNGRDYDGFFTVEGDKENVHMARIILQDLEKEFYKEEYMKDLDEKKNYIDDLLKKAEKSIDYLKSEQNIKDK